MISWSKQVSMLYEQVQMNQTSSARQQGEINNQMSDEFGSPYLHPGVSHGVGGGGLFLNGLSIGRALGGTRPCGRQGVYEFGHHH